MTSAGPAASPLAATDLESQAWRDRFLSVSAFVFAGSAALFAVSLLLQLLDAVESDALVGYSVGTGFQMLSPLVAIPALSTAALAFLLGRRGRAQRLSVAAGLLAAGFTLGVVGEAVIACVAGTHDEATKVVAGTSADAAGDLGLAVAAVVAAVAFSRAQPSRDRLLGWGSVAIAVAFAFTATSTFLYLSFVSDVGATDAYQAGVRIAGAGDSTTIAAGVAAAIAFFVSSPRRDGVLAAATTIFAVAFLLNAIGVTKVAAADPDNGFTGKARASDWLAALGYYGLVLTAVCAAAGFALTQRAGRVEPPVGAS